MGGAVPSLPQYAFMAWCSVRGSTGTTYFSNGNIIMNDEWERMWNKAVVNPDWWRLKKTTKHVK
jgi:hypothetical protein